ncbi:MAG: DUF1775 domain-containing protein [Actinobacteria bacterium]|nr:DUF1775 domain-containing protein [Actinomycetota bacterium]MSZ23849.1 DUF1775 domain-containing protein [Actinomycetota bacterium]MSZ92743.1 DUF1775 domain-containing protein [Actinomycetota bacterium]
MHMTFPRRFLIASAASLTALVALAGPAFAHADATAKADQAGRTAITISIEHGCNGNPVTGVRVSLPAGATAVTGVNSGAWTSTVAASEISWTGGSMPANSSADFDFSLVLAQPAGDTITLPTIQTCSNNTEIAWIQAATGDTSEANRPAPQIVVPQNSTSATTAIAGGSGSSTTATARMATQSNAVTDAGSETSTGGRYVFIGVCAVIVVGAGALFLKYRKHPTKS